MAVKVVIQDKKHKNRELLVIKELGPHPNIVKLLHEYFTAERKDQDKFSEQDQLYLNLVMEYIPWTLMRARDHFSKVEQAIPPILVKVYAF